MAKDPRFDPDFQKTQQTRESTNQIQGKEIGNTTILTEHLVNGAVTGDKLAAGAVTPEKLLSNWPVFYAWIAGGQFNTVTGPFGDAGKPVYNSTRVNNGNYYNTSNGRFTVPITGIYEFNFALIHRYSSGAGNLELTFYVNGANASPRSFSYSVVTAPTDHDWVHTQTILSLTAGQYVQCGIAAINPVTDYYYGENLGYFSGKLIR